MTESSLCTIMTYNMSFTTQMNESTFGSEKDFVERCQQVYKRGGVQCTDNAIKKNRNFTRSRSTCLTRSAI